VNVDGEFVEVKDIERIELEAERKLRVLGMRRMSRIERLKSGFERGIRAGRRFLK
jgi:hypothetical protein